MVGSGERECVCVCVCVCTLPWLAGIRWMDEMDGWMLQGSHQEAALAISEPARGLSADDFGQVRSIPVIVITRS